MVKTKPLLRGYFHQEAFFIALGASALLIAKANTDRALVASIVYAIGLLLMLGISALYHRPTWQPAARALMKRLDHSAIFVQIAGTFTPICLLALVDEQGIRLLVVVWAAAVLGIAQSVLWAKAPKWLSAILYVTLGWFALPYLGELKLALGPANLFLLAGGGVAYTIGAVFYASKRPNLFPGIFGYHELFHALTIVGALLHFIVVYQLIH